MTINVALEEDGYGVSVSHPTANSIVHSLKDRISLEKLQMDLMPDIPKNHATLFDVDLFLHLKKETKLAMKADNERKSLFFSSNINESQVCKIDEFADCSVHSEKTSNASASGEDEFKKRLDSVKQLREEINTSSNNKRLKTHAKHLCHELVHCVRDGDMLKLNSSTGKGHSTWVKLGVSRGGEHVKSQKRIAQPLQLSASMATKMSSLSSRRAIISRVEKSIGIVSTTASYLPRTQCKKHLIVLKPEDQVSLQRAGGMTDNGARKFDRLLVELTGLSIRNYGTTIGALTDGNLPSFTVKKVNVTVKDQIRERRMFIVDSVSGYICKQLKRLIENDLFVPSSTNTCLLDNTVIVRLGGDKGGKEMMFKFGFSIMNQSLANSPEAFDLCVTLDAFDTYANLQCAIFNEQTGWKSEMKMIFEINPPPHFIILTDNEDEKLLLVKLVSNKPNSPSLEVIRFDGTEYTEIGMNGIFEVSNFVLGLGVNEKMKSPVSSSLKTMIRKISLGQYNWNYH